MAERLISPPEEVRKAFNLCALVVAGYTYPEIEALKPAMLNGDQLHQLIHRKTDQAFEEQIKKLMKSEAASRRPKSKRGTRS